MFINQRIELKVTYKQGIFVLDDVLSDKQVRDFDLGLKKFNVINDYVVRQLNTWNEIKFAHPLLRIASKYFNFKSHYRYEVWQHLGTRPNNWHIDKDEILDDQQGITDCPLFGLIYYPSVQYLRGGNLLFRNGITIVPQTNRLVIHSPPVIEHRVDEYEGYRHSININTWNKKKLGVL